VVLEKMQKRSFAPSRWKDRGGFCIGERTTRSSGEERVTEEDYDGPASTREALAVFASMFELVDRELPRIDRRDRFGDELREVHDRLRRLRDLSRL
jgi:hypothetical protein